MSLSRRGFLTALASAPVAATLPPPWLGPMSSAKAQQAAAFAATSFAELHHPDFESFALRTGEAVRPALPRASVDVLGPLDEPAALETPLPSEPDMTLIDFLNSVNGQPWTEDRHCLAFAEEVQRRFFGRALPLPALPRSPGERHVAIHTDPARARWVPVDGPAHGAIVLMSPRPENRIDCHIGVCLLVPEPVVAHTDRPQGVCVDDLMTLRARGWHPTFWMPA